MSANLTKKYPIESTPLNQSEPAHSPPRTFRLAGPPVVESYDALRSAGHVQPPLGRVIKLSLTAETPGVDSAATRIAFLSASDLVIPQRSATPPFTVTFSSKVCAQVCPFRWACLQPPRTMPLGSSFRAMHQIALADDPNQLALIIYNGGGADSAPQKRFGNFPYRKRGLHSNHGGDHHIVCFHRRTPFSTKMSFASKPCRQPA